MITETKRNLHADLAICNAATPGPWSTSSLTEGYVIAGEDKFTTVATVIEYNDDGSEYLRLGHHDCQDNQAFIAEAREGWPEAIRRALTAEAEVERLREKLAQIEAAFYYAISDEEFTCALVDILYVPGKREVGE